MNKLRLLLIALTIGPAVSAAADELSETGEMLDGIAAIVNEGVVLKSQLNAQVAAITERARAQNIQLPPRDILLDQILEQLIVEEIQKQRADRIGIQISDQELNRVLANIAQQAGIPFNELPAKLAEDGIDYGVYRREMRTQLMLEQLRQIDVVRRISVAPREIETCIADLEGNVVGNSDYKLSHILISVPEAATAEQFAAAREEAEKVHEQIMNGADFAAMAIQHSDSQTALEGGALEWRKGDQLPTLFADVVGDMTVGDVSDPVRAVSGYHIVRIDDMRGVNQKSEIEQVRVRHILVAPNEIIDDQTAQQLVSDARERILAGEDFAEVAKLLSDDTGSANDGGDTGWTNPGTFVPEFEEVANTIEEGVLSEPFQTRFGWHILEVTGRRTYDNTEEVKQQTCITRIRNSKLATESELYVRRIRDDAYVEKRI
ncbi:MAG: peptidylprolyl isomerase [Woeseiaceae bacterium]|nr:peptidylprolyl isomerase [Woeseiaceae bacterium]